MKIYTWIDGQTFEHLPNPFQNTSPLTDAWWLAHGGTISEQPDPEPEPETPHIYSKYKIKLACEELNIWEEVKSYIEQFGKWESFLLITDISSDNAEFQTVLPTLEQAFGENTVKIILEASEI